MSNELVRELVVDMAREIKRLTDRTNELCTMANINAENIKALAEIVKGLAEADIERRATEKVEGAKQAALWADQELYEIWRAHTQQTGPDER